MLFVPVVASAAGGFHYALPLGVKNPSGLIMRIDGHGVEANGYRPIVIEVTPRGNKPLPADRQLRVVLSLSRYGSDNTAKVSQIIELPEGSTSVKATVLVPQMVAWSALAVETFEGGEKHKDLSNENFRWPNTNGWQWTEARPALLFIDSRVPPRPERETIVQAFQTRGADPGSHKLPDVRPILDIFPDLSAPAGVAYTWRGGPAIATPKPPKAQPAAPAGAITDVALLALIAGRSRTEMLPPAELPSRWIEMSQYDVAVVSLADLALMAKNQPAQLAALRAWVSTGPVLVVYGVGDKFGRLDEVEKLLELTPLEADEDLLDLRGWTLPDPQLSIGRLRTPFDPGDGTAIPEEDGGPRTIDKGPPHASPFVLRPAATGRVVAVAAEAPFSGNRADWSWAFNCVEDHWKWFRRTGFSLQRTNADYWKLLIPGVGEAPIISFLLLVSLFAVAIGPINYLFLGRARRLYLLLLTVPVGAALVTIGLFLFALFSDGLGMRMRLRSYTDLDQRSGRAAVWSRQSYYAGMAPSEGLVFPEDATVFPIVHEPAATASDRATLLLWDGNQQLRRGYLSSRTAAQYMLCRATTTKNNLLVTEAKATGSPPTIENRLATRIRYLLLRDSRGDYFAGQSIADQNRKELSGVDPAAAAAAMGKLADVVRPDVPHGYDPKFHDDNFFLRVGGRRSRFVAGDGGAGDPTTDSSLLETNLKEALEPTNHPLVPGTYVAIVESSPVVTTGVRRGREESSLHIIRGHY
jgi:hypothetical protein